MSTTTPTFNYTQNAWEGSRYNSQLSLKEIKAEIVKEFKKKFPLAKLSITTQRYAGGQALKIALMSGRMEALSTPDRRVAESMPQSGYRYMSTDETMELWSRLYAEGFHSINRWHIDDDYMLTEYGKRIMKFVTELAQSYNFDDSDSQIDYFHVNFHLEVSVGKYDKKFIVA